MNRLIEIYRRERPSDARNDDAILLDLAQQFPDIIPRLPGCGGRPGSYPGPVHAGGGAGRH